MNADNRKGIESKINPEDIIESVSVNHFMPKIPESEKRELRNKLTAYRLKQSEYSRDIKGSYSGN